MASSEVFKVMALSGGGARGLFQAEYLAAADRDFAGGIVSQLDLIAGTSTGAITAGCLAFGIDPRDVRDLFHKLLPAIFPPRPLLRRVASYFAHRPRYDTSSLEATLNGVLGDVRMRDLTTPLVIAASSIADHQMAVFSSVGSDDTRLVDAILASAAAPSYFPPRKIGTDGPGFVDGGLWANDPSLLALLYARSEMRVDGPIRVLNIGTGHRAVGSAADRFARTPTASLEMISAILEMTGSLQASFTAYSVGRHLSEMSLLRVDPEILPLKMDDAEECRVVLPGIARTEYLRTRQKLHLLLSSPVDPLESDLPLSGNSGVELIASNSRYTELILKLEKSATGLKYIQWRVPVFFKTAEAIEAIASGRWPDRSTDPVHRKAWDNYVNEHHQRLQQFSMLLQSGTPVHELVDRRRLEEYVETRSHAGSDANLSAQEMSAMLHRWADALEKHANYEVALTSSTLPTKYRIIQPSAVLTHEPVEDPSQISGTVFYGRAQYDRWVADFDRKWRQTDAVESDKAKVVDWIRNTLVPSIIDHPEPS